MGRHRVGRMLLLSFVHSDSRVSIERDACSSTETTRCARSLAFVQAIERLRGRDQSGEDFLVSDGDVSGEVAAIKSEVRRACARREGLRS
jgi:hypothetical protein